MINWSLNELKLIAQYRNISDYENKSKKDLIKALSEPKRGINKKKLEEIRKDFYKLRHKFSKKEADKYRKVFYDIKNYRHLSESEIEEIRKNFNELEKRFMIILTVSIMMILIIMIIITILPMITNTEKLGVLEHYLKNW